MIPDFSKLCRVSSTAAALGLLLAAGCPSGPEDSDSAAPVLEPGELQVGVARVRMPAPVGIGTVGYGGFGVSAEPSPFSELYPATTGIHNHPDFRAVAISRGEGFELVFLRADTVGTFQQLRRAVVLEVLERTGRDLDDALVIGSTHTHSGPGRVIDAGGPFDLIADRFFPEFYERMVDAMADTVVAAMDDLEPGRVGYGFADAPDGIDDRRCEDGQEYKNSTLPVVAVEQGGEIVGLHLAYAIHGTVHGIDDLLLSQDVSGGIEQAVQGRFDHDVHVQMFNSWGGDMSPANPDVDQREGAVQDPAFDRVERVGVVVADAVEAALSDLTWTDEPEIAMRTWRVPIDRDVIGYEDGIFEYDYGAVYCSVNEELLTCDGDNYFESLDEACVPFSSEFPAPDQTTLSAGRLAGLYFVTFPGEPGTLLAEQVMNGIRDNDPDVEDIAFYGYSQDYLGYSILEDDWWNGGYEASGALWGPKQGEYLSGKTIEAFDWTFGGTTPTDQRDPIATFEVGDYTPYTPAEPVSVGTILVEPAETAVWTDTLTFEVAGNDPWLGAPLATLQHADGTPVTRPGGQPVDSDGQAFSVRLVPEPGYADAPDASSRTFRWIFEMPVRHQTDVKIPDLTGDYQIEVSIPSVDGTLTPSTTRTFTVSAP